MKNLFKNIIKQNRGQALLETAMILPIIFIIIYGMIGISSYIYDKSVYVLASSKALDMGIGMLGRDDLTEDEKTSIIEETAMNSINIALFTSDSTVDVTHDTSEGKLAVEVKSKFTFILPFIEEIFEDDLELKSESTYIYRR